MDAYLSGAATTRFGRRSESLAALAREAGEAALAAAGVDRPDHVLVSCQFPGELGDAENVAVLVADTLGLLPVPAARVEAAPASGSAAVALARALVRSGEARDVLVLGVERMTHRPSAEIASVLARMTPPSERALGLTMPALTALMARRWMHATGASREDLALAPVKAHRHAVGNPHAQFRKPVTVADVLASPPVADPLRVLDCAPVTDGAAAVVVSHRGPVRIAGVGQATDTYAYTDRRGEPSLVGFPATRVAAHKAFSEARKMRRDVDVVEHHDAFSVLEFANVADLGLLDDPLARLEDGTTSLGGALPTNVGGGLKARGHPVGATGLAQAVELFAQLTRNAGARQVDGAKVALAHNIGGFGSNVFVTLYEAVA